MLTNNNIKNNPLMTSIYCLSIPPFEKVYKLILFHWENTYNQIKNDARGLLVKIDRLHLLFTASCCLSVTENDENVNKLN